MTLIHNNLINCLTPIIGLVSIYCRASGGYMENIKNNVDKAITFSHNIIDIFKMNLGKYEIEPYEYTINDIMNCITKHEKINAKYDENIELTCDKRRLIQALDCLLENSIKSIDPDNGSIKINISEKEELIVISIEDNGKGIPKNIIKDGIFEIHSDDDRIGFGLYITKNVIEAHDGKIYYDKDFKDGTCFVIELKKKK